MPSSEVWSIASCPHKIEHNSWPHTGNCFWSLHQPWEPWVNRGLSLILKHFKQHFTILSNLTAIGHLTDRCTFSTVNSQWYQIRCVYCAVNKIVTSVRPETGGQSTVDPVCLGTSIGLLGRHYMALKFGNRLMLTGCSASNMYLLQRARTNIYSLIKAQYAAV